MGELAEKYGYGGGEGLTIIDGEEAWLFEICGPGPFWSPGSEEPGAVWVAQRIPDDRVLIHANRSRIGEIDLENTTTTSWPLQMSARPLSIWDCQDGEGTFLFYTYRPKDAFYNKTNGEFSIFLPPLWNSIPGQKDTLCQSNQTRRFLFTIL